MTSEGSESMHEDLIYHGYRPQDGAGAALIAIETPDGAQVGVVRHVVKHSPSGLSWGYSGSGPADCARSILIAAIGEDQALCLACGGTRRVVYDPTTDDFRPYVPGADADADYASTCGDCDDGYRQLPYQQFKFDVVAGWGDEWRMPLAEVVAWLSEHTASRQGSA
jgi:hypothetical protein